MSINRGANRLPGGRRRKKLRDVDGNVFIFLLKQPLYIFNAADTNVHKPPSIISFKFYLVQARLLHFNPFQNKPWGSTMLTPCSFMAKTVQSWTLGCLGARILEARISVQFFWKTRFHKNQTKRRPLLNLKEDLKTIFFLKR